MYPPLLPYLVSLLLILGLSLPTQAQTQPADSLPTNRLLRYYPLPPFDRGGDGFILGSWIKQTEQQTNLAKSSTWTKRLSSIVIGPSFPLGKWTLSLDGLAFVLPERNKMDGVWMGYEIQLTYQPTLRNKWMLRSSNNTSQYGANWYSENNLIYYYAPEREGMMMLSGGYTSRETAHLTPEELLLGYYVQPLGTNSVLRNYRKSYLGWRNRVNISNHWDVSTLVMYENRHPQPQSFPSTQHHQALVTELGLAYTFGRTDLSQDSRFAGSPFPIAYYPRAYQGVEVGLTYRAAHPAWQSNTPWSRYQALSLHLRGNWVWDENNILDYQLTAGKFVNQARIYDADEWTLPQALPLSRLPMAYHWQTLPNAFVTDRQWGSSMVNFYSTNYLLLGRLLQRTAYQGAMSDALHLRLYTNYAQDTYLEGGYSIGFGRLARLGIFCGSSLDQRRPLYWNLCLSLPLMLVTSSWSERF